MAKKKEFGEFVTRGHSEPVTVVHCADWEKENGKERVYGEFVSKTRSETMATSNCSDWKIDRPYIEIRFTNGSSVSPTELQDNLEKVMLALNDLRPELKLMYDVERSRREGDDAIVALTPQVDDPGVVEKLKDLMREVKAELSPRETGVNGWRRSAKFEVVMPG